MANTYTTPTTNVKTYARIIAIRNQFAYAFKMIYDYSPKEYGPYLDVIEDKKINYITFWGCKFNELKNKNEKWCELTIYVDWEKHNSFMLSGETTIALSIKRKGIIPETECAVDLMVQVIKEYELTPRFSVGFTDNITTNEHDRLMKVLGLVKGSRVEWHGTKELIRQREIPSLNEMRTEFYVANE